MVASNRIGKEIVQTEHGNSEITFYGNSFIAGIQFILFMSKTFGHMNEHGAVMNVHNGNYVINRTNGGNNCNS